MSVNLWKKLIKNGALTLPYTLIRLLGVFDASVLMQILAEYNRACRDHLNLGEFVLVDYNRMSDYLNMDYDDLIESVKILQKYDFIVSYYSGIDNTHLIRVKNDIIEEYVEKYEIQNQLDTWDCGLARTQNPINRKNNFSELTLRIKSYVDEYFNKIDYLPLITYSVINEYIKNYEEQWFQLNQKINVISQIIDLIKNSENLKYDLANLINNLYIEHLNKQ